MRGLDDELLRSLREGEHAGELRKAAEQDAGSGRMTPVVPVATLDRDGKLLARRFSRVEGVRKDGLLNEFRQTPLCMASYRYVASVKVGR